MWTERVRLYCHKCDRITKGLIEHAASTTTFPSCECGQTLVEYRRSAREQEYQDATTTVFGIIDLDKRIPANLSGTETTSLREIRRIEEEYAAKGYNLVSLSASDRSRISDNIHHKLANTPSHEALVYRKREKLERQRRG